MKITEQEVTYLEKITKVAVEVREGVTVTYYVHRKADTELDNYENDCEPAKYKDEDIIASLTDEEQDELNDLITTEVK